MSTLVTYLQRVSRLLLYKQNGQINEKLVLIMSSNKIFLYLSL